MSLTPLYDRVRLLEDRLVSYETLVRQLQARLSRAGEGRNPRLARTVAVGGYPTRADNRNTWTIAFVDSTFTATAGIQSITTTARQTSNFAVAHNLFNDPFVPQNTLLQVLFDNGRWWFEYRDEVQLGKLQGALTAGGSVSVKAQLNGADQPGGAVQCYDKLGVMSGAANMKCYFQWQREHAQYWILNMECDDSLGIGFPVIQPAVIDLSQPRGDDRYRGWSNLAMQHLG